MGILFHKIIEEVIIQELQTLKIKYTEFHLSIQDNFDNRTIVDLLEERVIEYKNLLLRRFCLLIDKIDVKDEELNEIN